PQRSQPRSPGRVPRARPPPRLARVMTTVGIATGAGRGMGRMCADRLADMVDVLILVDLSAASLATAADELSAPRHRAVVETMTLDITDADALSALAALVNEL